MSMLIVPTAAFALLAVAAWGIGDAVLSRLIGPRFRSLGITSFALAILCGIGVIGQIGFILGLFPGSYRPLTITGALAALAVLAVLHVTTVRRELRLIPADVSNIRGVVWIVAFFTIWYLGRWLGILAGFPDGSDVFSHHYSHAKVMLQLHRFGYDVRLPYGDDHISNYNPALAHIVYVAARATGGNRAANLFHWLTDLMLFAMVYGAARVLRSRAAGAMALAIYLGMALVTNYGIEVQDYVLFSAFLIASITLLILAAREGNRRLLFAAALYAGFVLSTKYYALILVPLMVLLILVAEQQPWWHRVRSAAVFGAIAVIVYAPWPVYFAIRFGDPIYPFLRGGPWVEVYRALTPIHLLSRFMTPADTGLIWPWFRYLTALFLPVQPSFNVWTLTPLFIPGIGLLCAYALVGEYRNEGLLLGVWSVVAFVVMGIVFASGSVKWTYFPACVLCVALAICVADWRPVSRICAWALVLVVAGLSYANLSKPYLESGGAGTRFQEEERWTPLVRRLNTMVEPRATVAGIDYLTKFYLRDDIWTIEGQDNLCDNWSREEKLLERERARYYVVDTVERSSTEQLYESAVARWRQIGEGEGAKAHFLESFLQRYRVRSTARDEYLQRHASLIDVVGTVRIYRLDR